MIGFPPSSAGGLNETTVDVSPASTCSPVGAPGAAAGIAEADELEYEDMPTPLIAATVNVYEPPLISPVIVAGEDETVKVSPVGETLTM